MRTYVACVTFLLGPPSACLAQRAPDRVQGIEEELELIADRLDLRRRFDVNLNAKWLDKRWRPIVAAADAKISAAPGNHRGHALKYLAHLELRRDRESARKAAQRALASLDRPTQLALFLERALFVSPTVAEYRLALMRLSVLVPDARDNGRLRALHVQALLGSGKVEEAKVTNKNILTDIGDDIRGLRALVRCLCEAPNGISMADLATAALKKSIAMQGESQANLLLQYRVQSVLLRDDESARELGERIVARVPADTLNDWLWDLVARRSNVGKYPGLALIAAHRLRRLPGIGYQELDTIALAMFRSGRIDDAIDYQVRALASGGDTDVDCQKRMKIYDRAKKLDDRR